MRQTRRTALLCPGSGTVGAFTIVEVLVALVILAGFGLASTATLNLFEARAAKNRNAEAARAVTEDYTNFLLNDSTSSPTATATGTDIDGDGTPDGVVCTVIDTRSIPDAANPNGTVPLVVTRTATPNTVVSGTLYWRVQAVGTSYGMTSASDLLQVNFLLAYTYRGKPYYFKAVTFKASN